MDISRSFSVRGDVVIKGMELFAVLVVQTPFILSSNHHIRTDAVSKAYGLRHECQPALPVRQISVHR